MLDAEICGIPVGVLIFGLLVWWAIYAHQEEKKKQELYDDQGLRKSPANREWKQQKDEQTGVKWTARVSFPFVKIEKCKELVRVALCEGAGCELARETSKLQLFERGDSSIRALPTDRDVAWLEFPLTIRVTYEDTDEDKKVSALIKYEAPPAMTFSSDCARLFRENAENETTRLTEAAQTHVQHLGVQLVAQINHDLEELGLSVDASWEEIQSAFRRLSKKYHPDALASQAVSPEIVNLASEKFKSIYVAYQRLKELFEDEDD